MAPAVAAKAHTSEAGYVSAVDRFGTVWDDTEETAALAYPQSVTTFDRMRRNGTVHTVLAAVTHPVRRPGLFAIDPQGADPARVATLAEDLDLPIIGQDRPPPVRRRGRFSWLEHVRLSLLQLAYGHMAFEFLVDPDALKDTGMARLWKLAPRFPSSIEKINVARDGGLESIVQHRIGTEPVRPIPVANLVWYAWEREGAAWWGRSMLRPCYGDWLALTRLVPTRSITMERQAMGVPVGKAQEGADQTAINAMQDLASKARSGEMSGVGLEHGQSLTFEGVRGTLPDISGAIADHRAALADAVLQSWLRLGTHNASGNRALGQTFVDQATQSVQMVAGAIADVATQHVVEDLWDLNYGPSDPAPAVVAHEVDAEEDLEPEELVRLARAGIITADDSLEDLQRARYKLGRRDDGPGRRVAPGPAEPLEASRRRRPLRTAQCAAAADTTWRDRVVDAMAALVDPEAIADAALAGSRPADAVAAGVTDDPSPLAAVLVAMWSDSYGRGAASATEALPTSAARRGAPVMASLADLVAKAGEIATGILATLRDRLVAGVAAQVSDATGTPDRADLAATVQDLARDAAAAERVAATEAHRAEVAAAMDTYRSAGITELQWVQTTGEQDECSDRNGEVEDWSGDAPPIHPHCRCFLAIPTRA